MQQLPLSVQILQGAVSKRLVVKHYRHGIVLTKFFNMSRVRPANPSATAAMPSGEVWAFARTIFQDMAQKQAWHTKLGKPRRLFQALIKAYLKENQSKGKTGKAKMSQNTRGKPHFGGHQHPGGAI